MVEMIYIAATVDGLTTALKHFFFAEQTRTFIQHQIDFTFSFAYESSDCVNLVS